MAGPGMTPPFASADWIVKPRRFVDGGAKVASSRDAARGRLRFISRQKAIAPSLA
jgi:hypothetical protein